MCYLLPALENSTSPTQSPLHCILQSTHLPVDSNSEILTTANYDFCLLYCTQRDSTTKDADNSPLQYYGRLKQRVSNMLGRENTCAVLFDTHTHIACRAYGEEERRIEDFGGET